MPLKLLLWLERGDLTWEEFALLGFFHLRQHGRGGEVATTLAALLEQVGWGRERGETLRRMLSGLRGKGLIDYESTPGQRRPYVVRLTGAGLDLHTTSSSDPSLREEVTSTVRRSRGGAIPHGKTDRPPHDLHRAAVPRREVEENYVVDGLDGFEQAILPLGSATSAQREEWFAAWHENEAGVRRVIAEAASARAPAGLVTTKIREGAHRVEGEPAREQLHHMLLGSWLTNEGRFYEWKSCEDEIGRLERLRRVTLTAGQREEIRARWEEIHTELEPNV